MDGWQEEEEIDYGQQYNYEEYEMMESESATYEKIPLSSIFNQIRGLVQQTMQTVALPFGWSLLLLREFKWQVDFLGEYFQNMHKYKSAIGYTPGLLSTEEAKKRYSVGDCGVCLGRDVLIVNICKDAFCRNCWAGHIEQLLKNMNPFMKCMNCQTPLLHQTIQDILINTEQSNEFYKKLYNRYQKQICEFFTNTSRSYQCCPGADCNYCIKCENYSITTVKCLCGKSFCFKCQSDDHSPCTCDEKNKWTEIVLKEEANAKWIAQNTKLCPWCHKAVERSQGCNFMACLCGKSFCYMCSQPWEPDHKDHFKCHIYRKRNDDEVNRQKAVLQKLNFFAEKYLNTNGVVQSLKKFDTFQKRKFLYEKLDIGLTQSDFIDQAYKFAIECCESLKWIYVYTYFVEILDQNRKQRFLFSQGQYESFKEELLKKLSFDLKNFLATAEKNLDPFTKTLEYGLKKKLTDEFWNLKTNIINYYRFTQQFKQKFIQQVETLDSNMIQRGQEKSSQQIKKPELKKASSKKK